MQMYYQNPIQFHCHCKLVYEGFDQNPENFRFSALRFGGYLEVGGERVTSQLAGVFPIQFQEKWNTFCGVVISRRSDVNKTKGWIAIMPPLPPLFWSWF